MLMYTTTFLGYDFFFIFCYIDFVKSLNRINQQFNQVSINFVIWIEGSIICHPNYDFPLDFCQTSVVHCL